MPIKSGEKKKYSKRGQSGEIELLAYSLQEAADALGISQTTIKRLLNEGVIKERRVGVRHVIPKSEIEKYLTFDD